MKPIISVHNLSKQYRIGVRETYGTLRDALVGAVRAPFSRLSANGRAAPETIWALRDVNFEVAPGEVVGIIGRNGAGKSTLLKILSRITEPTTGRVELFGRVGSLLEVGTGFHPELTGRENVFLNGAILGMGRSEIEQKFDEIVSFAEIERFLDTPVKRYSSGMYTRLAFAVAAHLEPEILVVDEVLAVGDVQFQRKCLGKMDEVAREGRTVLFVSHNMTAIQSLCRRAILLESGQKVADGEAGEVVSKYLKLFVGAKHEQQWDDPDTAPGTDAVRLRLARVVPEDGSFLREITVRTPLKLEFQYWNFLPGTEQNLTVHVFNIDGTCVFASGSAANKFRTGIVRGVCHIPANLLNDGTYRLSVMIVSDQSKVLYTHETALVFDVHDVEREGGWYDKWPGAVRPYLQWTVDSLNDESAEPNSRN
jgi:lipopolysaccharide transport system ATP-binding protein